MEITGRQRIRNRLYLEFDKEDLFEYFYSHARHRSQPIKGFIGEFLVNFDLVDDFKKFCEKKIAD